ncbi:MAG: glutathione peroxidase [Pseudomonadales bacterium]|nr:glutathione peroxidase [Pseudomonadales bacterium]
MTDIYEFSGKNIKGEDVPLSDYKGKVLLIVNTASKCGFTPQYKGLESLYKNYQDKGLEILGFPCNQFGKQEPGNSDDISEFCELNFGVTFPLFEKVEVNGPNTHPLYDYLKKEAPGLLGSGAIKWNFTKFLVDGDGNVVKRFSPTDTPEKIEKHVKSLLA